MRCFALPQLIKIVIGNQYDLSSVKYIYFSGRSIHDNTFESLKRIFPNANLYYCYGMTEFGGKIAQTRNNRLSGSCGKLVRNMELKVIDKNGSTIADYYKEGEFCIRSPKVTLGYYNSPATISNTIDSDGWYHTGDIGYHNETGDIFITDRIKDVIKYMLLHVSPSAIENIIMEHEGVNEVAVVKKLCNEYGEVPFAFVVKKQTASVTEGELIDLVEQQGSVRLNLKGGVKFVNELPKTSTGKIRKFLLQQMIKDLDIE